MSERIPFGPENQPQQPGNELVPVEVHHPVPIESSNDNLPVRPWGNEVAIPEVHDRSVTNYYIGQVVVKQELHARLPERLPETPSTPETPNQPINEEDPTTVLSRPKLPPVELRKSVNWANVPKAEETDMQRQKRVLYGDGRTDAKTYRSKTDKVLDAMSPSKAVRAEGKLINSQKQIRDSEMRVAALEKKAETAERYRQHDVAASLRAEAATEKASQEKYKRRALKHQHKLSGQPGGPSRSPADFDHQGIPIGQFRRAETFSVNNERRQKEKREYKKDAKGPRQIWRSIRKKGQN